MSFKTKLLHWKIGLFGHKELEKKGVAILPCKKCDKKFKSYAHHDYSGLGEYTYDIICKECEK